MSCVTDDNKMQNLSCVIEEDKDCKLVSFEQIVDKKSFIKNAIVDNVCDDPSNYWYLEINKYEEFMFIIHKKNKNNISFGRI